MRVFRITVVTFDRQFEFWFEIERHADCEIEIGQLVRATGPDDATLIEGRVEKIQELVE